MQTPFSPLSFGKSFMKIRSAVPENGYLVFLWRTKKKRKKQKKNKKKQKNICKTYTHPPHRRLRKLNDRDRKLSQRTVCYLLQEKISRFVVILLNRSSPPSLEKARNFDFLSRRR